MMKYAGIKPFKTSIATIVFFRVVNESIYKRTIHFYSSTDDEGAEKSAFVTLEGDEYYLTFTPASQQVCHDTLL